MLKSIIKFIFGLLVFILIVDPGDLLFHLKMPLFTLIFGTWLLLKTFKPLKIDSNVLIISFIFLIIPFIGIISAIIQNNFSDITFAVGFIKSFSVIILLIVIIDLKIPTDTYLIRYSFIIPFIIIPIYILLILNPDQIGIVFNYLNEKDVAKFSNRDFYGYKIAMLYYRTSPLLVFPLAFYCNKFAGRRNKVFTFFFIFLFLFTLILSGTRANMLSGVAITIYFLFSYFNKKRNKLPLIITYALVIFTLFSFIRTLSFSQEDSSSEVKAGHVESYIKLFDENPHYLLWGEGLGSTFYSSGNGTFVAQTELTYLDMIRWFGLPITILLLFLLLYPIMYLYLNKQISNHNKSLIVAYFAYLFIVGTNPLLISSTGMLVVITMYSLIKPQSSKIFEQPYPILYQS